MFVCVCLYIDTTVLPITLPVMFVCSNGVGRTGVFMGLHIILERMLVEGLVDVFQTVKNLRIQRPAMVQTLVCLKMNMHYPNSRWLDQNSCFCL